MSQASPEPRIIAEVRDSTELRRWLRERADELNLSRETIDDLAKLPDGYTAKLLSDPPMREIGPTSLFPLLDALGLAVALVENERAMVRVRKAPTRRFRYKWDRHWRNAKALGMVQEMAVKTGSEGGRARFSRMTPKQKSAHQSRAARARWRAIRRARKLRRAQASV